MKEVRLYRSYLLDSGANPEAAQNVTPTNSWAERGPNPGIPKHWYRILIRSTEIQLNCGTNDMISLRADPLEWALELKATNILAEELYM